MSATIGYDQLRAGTIRQVAQAALPLRGSTWLAIAGLVAMLPAGKACQITTDTTAAREHVLDLTEAGDLPPRQEPNPS
jgi:hypothetical protein